MKKRVRHMDAEQQEPGATREIPNRPVSNAEAQARHGLGGGKGASLEADLAWASEMLGVDLSAVPVHVGGGGGSSGGVDESLAAAGAEAMTRDGEVWLPGSFRPGTPEGRELLVHELTHVLQQGGPSASSPADAATPSEAAAHLARAREVLEQALLALDDGRAEVLGDGERREAEAGRGPLRAALAELGRLDPRGDAAEAAGLSFLVLEGVGDEGAGAARATSERLADVDGGPTDALEREAHGVARAAATGSGPVPQVRRRSDTPGTQRMAAAAATLGGAALVGTPPGWLLLALGAAVVLTVAVVAGPSIVDSVKERTRTKDEAQTKAEPKAVPTTQERRRDWGLMRFQIQWDTKGSNQVFSTTATAASEMGVTSAEAQAKMRLAHAQVAPSKAKAAAIPAVEEAVAYIRSAPAAGGIAGGGRSKSFYFSYKNFGDARADVENLKGHNLRI